MISLSPDYGSSFGISESQSRIIQINNELISIVHIVLCPGGSCEDDPRRQSGGRGDVPPGHRASSGERRGLLELPGPATPDYYITYIVLESYIGDCKLGHTNLFRKLFEDTKSFYR